jgi:16S rRNA (cytidine1402-2'-O)-methyltransferase
MAAKAPALKKDSGILYVVATPIGNMADITLRAVQTLKAVDLVAAEDTRHTRRLLTYHQIKKPLVSYHEHNEIRRSETLVESLLSGQSVALVSNAGTPTISDPGYHLVKAALQRNIRVVPIPGVTAAVTALSASGMPTDRFFFLGFLPRKKGKREKILMQLAGRTSTLIFYESPKRILGLLTEMLAIFGDRYGVVSRELTKQHEEFIHGRLAGIIESIQMHEVFKGECTLVVAGNSVNPPVSKTELRKEITVALQSGKRKLPDIASELAGRFSLSKKKVYEEALRLKKVMDARGRRNAC